MSERHIETHDYFDVEVLVDDEGDVTVDFYKAGDIGPRELLINMSLDEFREIIDFVYRHGMGMDNPYVVEYSDTVEAQTA